MKFGRYEIKSELGRGSMGIVYQAHDPRLDRLVALKVLKADLVASETFVQRFLKEARAVARLTHPNIVSIYDADEDQGTIYIAMELLEGESLDSLIRKRKISENEIVRLGIQLAKTLDYAHQKGIIHRDIKPANIILDHSGQIKITDFGVARIEDPSAPQQTMAGDILGTPAYMSPEQALGQRVDGRTDIFSLGVVLYELCTGMRPFEGETLSAILMAIIHNHPPEPKTLNAAILPELARIIMRCLSKTADERFQTGNTLAEALGKIVRQEESTAPALPTGKKSALYVLILLLALGVGGGLFYQFLTKQSRSVVKRPAAESIISKQAPMKPVPAGRPETASNPDDIKRKIEEPGKKIAETHRQQDEADTRAGGLQEVQGKSQEQEREDSSVVKSENVGGVKQQELTSAKEALEKKGKEPGLSGKPAGDGPALEPAPPTQEQMKPAPAGRPETAVEMDKARRKIEELEKRIAETSRKQDEADRRARDIQNALKKSPEKKQDAVSVARNEKVEEARQQGPVTTKEALEKRAEEPGQGAVKNPQGVMTAESGFPAPGTRYTYKIDAEAGAQRVSFTVLEDAMFEKRKVHCVQAKENNMMQFYDIASRNWTAETRDGKIIRIAEPHVDMLRFPLFVGQKHQAEYSLTQQGKTYHVVQQVEVAAFEKVTVPSGTYDAFKIQVENRILKRTCWYSPELKIVVRWVDDRRREGKSTREMIEYKAP